MYSSGNGGSFEDVWCTQPNRNCNAKPAVNNGNHVLKRNNHEYTFLHLCNNTQEKSKGIGKKSE